MGYTFGDNNALQTTTQVVFMQSRNLCETCCMIHLPRSFEVDVLASLIPLVVHPKPINPPSWPVSHALLLAPLKAHYVRVLHRSSKLAPAAYDGLGSGVAEQLQTPSNITSGLYVQHLFFIAIADTTCRVDCHLCNDQDCSALTPIFEYRSNAHLL